MTKQKVLITGSNGLLGQHLVKLFCEDENYEVIATSRGHNRLRNKDGYSYVAMDVTDKDEAIEIITLERPDFIIHAAAMTQVDDCEQQQDECWKQNVVATSNLIAASRKVNASFLFLSTDFIFDGEDGPYREDDWANPVSYYGESKLAAETLVRESGLPWAIARTILVYGVAEDMSRSNIILWVKNSLEQKKAIKVVTDQWRSPTLVQDLAKGCKLIVEKNATGIYNISGKDILTPYDMAELTADYFDLDKSLISKADSSTFSQPARRPPKTGFILDKAINELAYAPHSFKEGIAVVANEMKRLQAEAKADS